VRYGVRIPKALSVLAFHNPGARVQGLDAVRPANRPPVNVVRFSFQTMVGIGTMLAILGILTMVVRVRRRRLPRPRAFYAAVAAAGPLSVVALVAGWVTTEVGRQPWVVYGVMRTNDAVTGAGVIPVSYAALWALYLAVGAGTAWILRRLARTPIEIPALAVGG
jgi:cytochrome bd ubiquinol oxidase subunit I